MRLNIVAQSHILEDLTACHIPDGLLQGVVSGDGHFQRTLAVARNINDVADSCDLSDGRRLYPGISALGGLFLQLFNAVQGGGHIAFEKRLLGQRTGFPLEEE